MIMLGIKVRIEPCIFSGLDGFWSDFETDFEQKERNCISASVTSLGKRIRNEVLN